MQVLCVLGSRIPCVRPGVSALLCISLAGCVPHAGRPVGRSAVHDPTAETLLDGRRLREVPILLYSRSETGKRKPLAVISHGYGGHSGDYTFVAEALARRGFIVASIEHIDRPGDPPIANSGDWAMLRRPVWQIGADTIDFVIAELARTGRSDPALGAVVVGHSNGGDMTMLYAAQHPAKVRVALSLDNRRMPLPRLARPRVCSLRSTDLAADPGVLPSSSEQQRLQMSIVQVPVAHNDMSDVASERQKIAMVKAIGLCLVR